MPPKKRPSEDAVVVPVVHFFVESLRSDCHQGESFYFSPMNRTLKGCNPVFGDFQIRCVEWICSEHAALDPEPEERHLAVKVTMLPPHLYRTDQLNFVSCGQCNRQKVPTSLLSDDLHLLFRLDFMDGPSDDPRPSRARAIFSFQGPATDMIRRLVDYWDLPSVTAVRFEDFRPHLKTRSGHAAIFAHFRFDHGNATRLSYKDPTEFNKPKEAVVEEVFTLCKRCLPTETGGETKWVHLCQHGMGPRLWEVLQMRDDRFEPLQERLRCDCCESQASGMVPVHIVWRCRARCNMINFTLATLKSILNPSDWDDVVAC